MSEFDRFQTSMFEDNAEYSAFVDKFKPKKTTDDCYTPQSVYDAVAERERALFGIAEREQTEQVNLFEEIERRCAGAE